MQVVFEIKAMMLCVGTSDFPDKPGSSPSGQLPIIYHGARYIGFVSRSASGTTHCVIV